MLPTEMVQIVQSVTASGIIFCIILRKLEETVWHYNYINSDKLLVIFE